jgi:cell division protease FtsH
LIPRQEKESQPGHSNGSKASWDTLIIPTTLRENLQAYVKILRDYEAYQAVGIKLPKGLLFFGPPGCGKPRSPKP